LAIVDVGYQRNRDLQIEVPGSPLEAIMSGEVWQEVYERLTRLIEGHRTTLVFVNTRRMAERVARELSERLGDAAVTAHHGSMARDQRLSAEQRLKHGKLKALVATASLELGIDIGDVNLVCQLGSPRSIAALLQRVGRSGHAVTGTPKGRLFPLSRDDLVECAALLDSVRRGELDRVAIPHQPLDVVAQQIVAEVAAQDWPETALYRIFRGAWPFRDLARTDFDAVVQMLADGFATRRGRRGALIRIAFCESSAGPFGSRMPTASRPTSRSGSGRHRGAATSSQPRSRAYVPRLASDCARILPERPRVPG
jgi:ATP-dependent Lhr-like helicase